MEDNKLKAKNVTVKSSVENLIFQLVNEYFVAMIDTSQVSNEDSETGLLFERTNYTP